MTEVFFHCRYAFIYLFIYVGGILFCMSVGNLPSWKPLNISTIQLSAVVSDVPDLSQSACDGDGSSVP